MHKNTKLPELGNTVFKKIAVLFGRLGLMSILSHWKHIQAISDCQILDRFMRVFQLVYRSRAAQVFTEEDLVLLLRNARAFNSQRDICGLLLYGYGTFIQVLEGKEADVRALYEGRISSDPRHDDLTLLAEGLVAQPRFQEWSMAFRALDPDQMKSLIGYKDPVETVQGQEKDLLLPLRLLSFVQGVEQVNNTKK
jgi:hypothetical protein